MIVANALCLPYRDRSAHFACCSPPYYMKRRYSGVEPLEWPAVSYAPMPGLPPITVPRVMWRRGQAMGGTMILLEDEPDAGILGLEPDPFAYIGHLILIAREVWRVLRDDGVWAVNLGDTYFGGGGGNYSKSKSAWGDESMYLTNTLNRMEMPGYKPKDLMLIPARFALAMIADGWTLRSRMPGGEEMRPDVIWKKNAMPESVRDRPSVDFEDVLIFSKGRRYFWDQENGRTRSDGDAARRWRVRDGEETYGFTPSGSQMNARMGTDSSGANMRAAWDLPRRETWKINTEPTDEEHYAAWPRDLVRRLIRIGTSDKGCCPECGAQWVRQVERGSRQPDTGAALGTCPDDRHSGRRQRDTTGAGGNSMASRSRRDLGWAPGCDCDASDPAPCRVLDPFSGIGRTGEVCYETGRIYMPAELSVPYVAIQKRRLRRHRAVRHGEALKREPATISGPLFS